MSNQKQQDSNFLSDSFFDEPIHDEHNQDSPDFVSNAWNTKLSPVKWKLEFYDAELYLFCQMQQQKCEINDLVQAATVQAITVEFSQSKECLVLWVDEGICWQLGASTRIIKESNFEYNIFIPSDEQLLLLLHHGTPQRLINQFDQELSRICQLDDSGAQIRSEWELVTEVSTPHTEDLVAEIIGRSGRGLAKGIDYSSSALQKNIERVGLFFAALDVEMQFGRRTNDAGPKGGSGERGERVVGERVGERSGDGGSGYRNGDYGIRVEWSGEQSEGDGVVYE
eukprot:TRINITY_DN29734_c0_g1_i5.p5 TRINITY_DN29734_c0_g1~~TRINITY_DN29734_c0_g1_i5.p5  ORF type:complete len:282 (+),score=41.92 TRINITY_DN29734_c0_g1_i5:169-1014(+)